MHNKYKSGKMKQKCNILILDISLVREDDVACPTFGRVRGVCFPAGV